MFLEEEEMMRMLALCLILLRRPVSLPLGHNVSYFLLGNQ